MVKGCGEDRGVEGHANFRCYGANNPHTKDFTFLLNHTLEFCTEVLKTSIVSATTRIISYLAERTTLESFHPCKIPTLLLSEPTARLFRLSPRFPFLSLCISLSFFLPNKYDGFRFQSRSSSQACGDRH